MLAKLIRRTLLCGLLLPFLYFGTASATFLFRIHTGNRPRVELRLAAYPAPRAGQRLLLFSPHPDDETLACGGLIRQAARAGAAVRVVMMTNGDGFRVAVERQYRELDIEPEDYIRFADLRQQECLRALGRLGLKRDDITFLGYPDRGLASLWSDHWTADDPYRSPYTRRTRSPYALGYHPDAVYCGQQLLEDIKEILRETRPTHIYVTHPSDDHPDHSASSAFVTLALMQLRQEGQEWAANCTLRFYLVHRGDWPVPQGLFKGEPLTPPGEMATLDTRWQALPLSAEDTNRKADSILTYASQTAVMKRFLLSFARQDEMFGKMDEARVARVANGAIRLDGDAGEWKAIPPAFLDPVNDSLLRDFQGGGDVGTVYACRDAVNLYLRLDTFQPVSNRVEFTLRFRYFGEASEGQGGGTCKVVLRPPHAASPPDLTCAADANRLEVAVPLRDLGYSRHVALNIETRFAGIQVDRTGYRFLRF